MDTAIRQMSTNELKKGEEILLGQIDSTKMYLRTRERTLRILQPDIERIERAYPPGTTPPPDVASFLDFSRSQVAHDKLVIPDYFHEIAEYEEALDKIRHELQWRKVKGQLALRGSLMKTYRGGGSFTCRR